MRPLIICTLFCCFNSLTVSAQRYDFHVGLRLGCGISSNSNVQHILVSEEYYSNYTFRKRLQVVPTAELYFLYKPQGNLWGIEAGITWKSHTNLTHPGKYFRPSKVKIMRPTSPK